MKTLFILSMIFLSIGIVIQFLYGLQIWEHRRFARKRISFVRTPSAQQPMATRHCLVVVPCKGNEPHLAEHLCSILRQDHPHYQVRFVLEDEEDPANVCVRNVCELPEFQHILTEIIYAGRTEREGQKVHNLRMATQEIPPHCETLAFFDSDVQLNPWTLRSLTTHFESQVMESKADESKTMVTESTNTPSEMEAKRNAKRNVRSWVGTLFRRFRDARRLPLGVTTGYRCMVPEGIETTSTDVQTLISTPSSTLLVSSNTLKSSVSSPSSERRPSPECCERPDGQKSRIPTRIVAGINLGVASLYGKNSPTFVWGGAWAMRRELFDTLAAHAQVDGHLSDDLLIRRILIQNGYRSQFEPAAMVMSPIQYDWRTGLCFVRRQYQFVRHYAFFWWLFALGVLLFNQLAIWFPLLTSFAMVWCSACGGSIETILHLLDGCNPLELLCIWNIYLLLYLANNWILRQIYRVYVPSLSRSKADRPWTGVGVSLLHLLAVLSAGIGRTICWRGIQYTLSQEQTVLRVERLDAN